jgi:CRISPR-associated protein Cmr1
MKMEVTLKTVTPMFLGGAEPNIQAELRAPSIKGALRFWYRAIDPEYKINEPKIFGSTDEGQGKFFLTLDKYLTGTNAWDRNHYCGYDEVVKPANPPQHSSSGDNTWTRNGNTYLGFPLSMKPNERKAIPAGETFTVKLIFRRAVEESDQKRILAAIWFFGHVGGLGFRTRRAFGTVALQSWKLPDDWLKNDELPPIAHGSKSAENWSQQFAAGLNRLKEWFPANQKADHAVLNSGSALYLFKNGYDRQTKSLRHQGQSITKTYEPWEAAMDVAGKAMQGFRQRWDLNNMNSDYYRVKQHLSAKHNIAVSGLTAQYLKGSAPHRTAFGLPLTFRYGSLEGAPSIALQGVEHDRSASPLFIRIVEIDGKCHPFFALLNSPLLAPNEKVADQRDVQQARRNATTPLYSYKTPPNNILQTFCACALKPNAWEVTW